MKRLLIFSLLWIVACSSKDEHPGLGKTDSLLVTPLIEQPDVRPVPDSTGLFVDSTMLREDRDRDTLKQISPKQVLDIYESYRPLRNGRTTQHSLDSFLAVKHLTLSQLHSVLAVGDRHGWSGAASQ